MFIDLSTYMLADSTYSNADIVIFSIPYDGTTSFKPGARDGGKSIREASWGLESYSPILDKDLTEINFCDLKDLDIYGSQKDIFNMIENEVKRILKDNKKICIFGGEHSITYPIVKGIKEEYDDFVVVQFDAHADLRDEYLGNKFSHACVMRRVREINNKVFQFGIRSGDKEEWEFIKKNNIYLKSTLPSKEDIEYIKELNLPVYLTVDIDVLDPAYAPGTGTPEPGGYSSRELFNSLYLFKDLDIIGFDIVEVAPIYDIANITAITAAKIARELLLIL